jgi:hypothetical protein
MAYEQRDLSGSLFKNDKREKDSHPNLTGTVMIDGKEYWASGWTKERNNGDKWISLSFKPKEARQQLPGRRDYPEPQYDGGIDDDVPF